MARESMEEMLRERLNFVELKSDGVHLYWKSARETLCGKNKVWALRLLPTQPKCVKCRLVVADLALARAFGAIRDQQDRAA